MTEPKEKQAWELAWEKEFACLVADYERGQLREARQWERAGFKYGYLAAIKDKEVAT